MGEKKSTAVKSWGRRGCGGTFLKARGNLIAKAKES
jgi:hypothetical protein